MLHPDCALILRALSELDEPPIEAVPVHLARASYAERGARVQNPRPDMATVRDHAIRGPGGDLLLRVYRPQTSSFDVERMPALVYFHGGGWLLGNIETHDNLCRELCELSGVCVVAVEYRLAPENPYPAALEDAWCAVTWVRDNAEMCRIDAGRLAVGGDSAGANLAAVMAIKARDSGALRLCFQLLVYPVLSGEMDSESYVTRGEGYILTKRLMQYFFDQYAPSLSDRRDWQVSPMLASSHADLPPALIITAGYDPLRDEGVAYAQKLTASGSDATLVNFERQLHGFITMTRVNREAPSAVRMCADAVCAALSLKERP